MERNYDVIEPMEVFHVIQALRGPVRGGCVEPACVISGLSRTSTGGVNPPLPDRRAKQIIKNK